MSRTVRKVFKRGHAPEWVYSTEDESKAFYSRNYVYRRWGLKGVFVEHFLDPKSKEGRRAEARWICDHSNMAGERPIHKDMRREANGAFRTKNCTEIDRYLNGDIDDVILDLPPRYSRLRGY